MHTLPGHLSDPSAVPLQDYNYYQSWSDNEWLVDEMLVILDEDTTMW